MEDSLFRKNSLDKIQSPDQLNDYIRVANPGIWMILIAIVVIYIGALFFGAFNGIKTTVPAHIAVDGGQIVCTVIDDIDEIEPGMTVEVGDVKGSVVSVDVNHNLVDISISLVDGVYEGQIVTEEIAPISFVAN